MGLNLSDGYNVNEHDAKIGFHRLNALAQRRLRHSHTTGGIRETCAPHKLDEILQVANPHTVPLPRCR